MRELVASDREELFAHELGDEEGLWDVAHHPGRKQPRPEREPANELGKELLAGFATAEVDKHLENGYYDHLDREQARFQAQQQASYLYDQQYGQYDPSYGQPQYGQY